MSKVAVYEGCPACTTTEFGQLAIPNVQTIVNTLQGGAVGGASGLAAEWVATNLLKITNPLLRTALVLGTPMAIAAFVQRQNPEMAKNIAIGGTAVGIYTLLKGMIGGKLPFSGYEGYGQIADVEIEDEGLGVLVPEIESEEYGVLVPEVESIEYSGYGQDEIYIEE